MRAYSTGYKKIRKQSHVVATGQENGELLAKEEEVALAAFLYGLGGQTGY